MKLLRWMPIPILFLLFLGGTSLWELFVQEQSAHLNQVFEFQTERLADHLFRTTMQDLFENPSDVNSWSTLPEGVLGFGIYNGRGKLQRSWGDTPDHLELDQERLAVAGRLFFASHPGVIDLYKGLEPVRPRPMLPDFSAGPPPRSLAPMRGVIFLRVSDQPLKNSLFMWGLSAFLGPLFWLVALGFIGFLWQRSHQYREAASRNQELLQYAEAARTLSHEIKNPLSAILIQTALLKQDGALASTPELTIIEEETQRINLLVSRVRDFLKDPAGQTEVIDLERIVQELSPRFSEAIPSESQGSGPFLIAFDPPRLRSVVENLLKNALESGPDPRPRTVLSRPRSGWIRLEILDQGLGFTAEGLKKAPTPFYTTKAQGSGMGLAIAANFLRAAGARLKWDNRPEGGAVVTVDFPEVLSQGVQK